MAHNVKLRLSTAEIQVAHKDIEVVVGDSNGKLGTLLISKGNIEWLPSRRSVKKHRFRWKRFAEIMESQGKSVRASR